LYSIGFIEDVKLTKRGEGGKGRGTEGDEDEKGTGDGRGARDGKAAGKKRQWQFKKGTGKEEAGGRKNE
jgi:hypothetical protein